MNKTLLIALIIVSASAKLSQVFQCGLFNCPNQLDECQEDPACM